PGGVIEQLVDGGQQRPRGDRRGGGGEVAVVEAHRRGEGGGVHAPLVLGAAARRGAQNHQLAVARRQRAAVEQRAAERAHALEQERAARERAKQPQRLDGGAGRHPPGQRGGQLGGVGRVDGGDARRGNGRHGILQCYSFCSATEIVVLQFL